MSFTNYLEHAVLDQIFGATTYSPSGTLYVGLSTTTPTESGTNFTEPSAGAGYARVAVTNNKTNWSTAAQSSTSGSLHNKTSIAFSSAISGWGTVTHVGVFDASGTGANMLIMNSLVQSKSVDEGDTLTFPSGGIIINID